MTDALTPGASFGDFRVEELIGRGGMGLVYRAVQVGLDRTVALKIIAPHLTSDATFVDRFRREARRAAAIDHPAIIPIYAAGEIKGCPYLAMRYIDGIDLRTLIDEQGRLELNRALALAHEIAGALDAAHAGGLVHRDVKPANILIETANPGRERAFLTDFGLTRGDNDTRLTETGEWLGTIDYMPPEQFQSDELDARTDQYALACVLYEMLTGATPFPRDVDFAAMYAHVHTPPPRLTDALRDLPTATDAVLAKAMAKQAADRYDTCEEFVDALILASAPPLPGAAPLAPTPGPLPVPEPEPEPEPEPAPAPEPTLLDQPAVSRPEPAPTAVTRETEPRFVWPTPGAQPSPASPPTATQRWPWIAAAIIAILVTAAIVVIVLV